MSLKYLKKFAVGFLLITAGQANADLIEVAFTGTFDESTIAAEGGLPIGDYDTIGGLEDVALFNLVEGDNIFHGTVYSAADPADVFTVGVQDGFRLIGATINWGTNLPSIAYIPFVDPAAPDGYLQQNTFGGEAPTWYFEESSTTPEIFTISNLEANSIGSGFDTSWDVAPSLYAAPTFSREQGIYSSLLDATGTCAQTYVIGGDGFLYTECAAGISYTMTYKVEALTTTPPPNPVPEPSTLAIFALGIMGLVSRIFKKL